jgi:hypothetical protein
VLFTVLGRLGQRPLNAVLLGGGAAAISLTLLRGAPHAWLPGIAAIVLAVLGGLFGLAAGAWGTAAVAGILLAAAGSAGSHRLGVFWPPMAMLFFGLGVFGGMVNRKRLPALLPPLFSAAFAALGAAICWAPHWRGALLFQLNDVDWVLGLALALAVPLLALSLGREHLTKLRLLSRTPAMDDEELKKKLNAQKGAYLRARAAKDDSSLH